MNKETIKKLNAMVRKNYQEIAAQYNETRKKHLEPVWGKIVALAESIPADARILDVGCGNGRLLEAFGNKKIDYLGVDTSQELLCLAQKNYPDKKFIFGELEKLGEIPDTNFDYVFSIAVIHHLPGQEARVAALKQLKNKTTADGKIIISAWNLWAQKKFSRLIWKFALLKIIKKNKMDFGDIIFDWKNPAGEKISQRYYHAFRKRELKKIASRAGLKIKELSKDNFNYYLILSK